MADDPSPPVSGAVVYFYAFDVAFEMQRAHLTALMGQPLSVSILSGTKRNPRRMAANVHCRRTCRRWWSMQVMGRSP